MIKDHVGLSMIPTIIGTIDFKGDIGICNIIIYPYEADGLIPHFHIESTTSNFKASLAIYDPEYIDHDDSIGRLNKEQLILLDQWMNESQDGFPNNLGCRVL